MKTPRRRNCKHYDIIKPYIVKWLESCNKGKVNNVNVKLIVEDHEDISIGTIVKVNLVANTTALQFKICSLGSQLEGGEE